MSKPTEADAARVSEWLRTVTGDAREKLAVLVADVRAEERAACANTCDERGRAWMATEYSHEKRMALGAQECAELIRRRGAP